MSECRVRSGLGLTSRAARTPWHRERERDRERERKSGRGRGRGRERERERKERGREREREEGREGGSEGEKRCPHVSHIPKPTVA
jgi:hypothetical protein